MTLRIGVPREIKAGENRVAVTPDGAAALAKAGARVVVQAGAGAGSAFEDGVRRSFRKIGNAVRGVGAREGGVLVCAMAPPGREVIVGATRDLQFGHAVMVGMGGVLVEVLKDVAFRIVPVTEKDAAEMLGELRGKRLLGEYRGSGPADVAALRRLIAAVSDLLERNPDVLELDLNPVIVAGKGLAIADARVVLGSGGE